jgi:hypothetical protein
MMCTTIMCDDSSSFVLCVKLVQEIVQSLRNKDGVKLA